MPENKDQAKAIVRLAAAAFNGTSAVLDAAVLAAGYIHPRSWRVRGRRVLAAFFGRHPNTIPQWEAAGMPIAAKSTGSAGNEYDLRACVAWRLKMLEAQLTEVAGGDDDNPELTRLRRLTADIKEIELGELVGLMVRRADVEEKDGAVVSMLTSSLGATRDILAQLVPEHAAEIHRRFDELLDRLRGQLGGTATSGGAA